MENSSSKAVNAGVLSTEAGRYWSGIAFVGVFVVIGSAREVYFGRLVQSLQPLLVAFVCFAITSIVLLVGYAANGGRVRADLLAVHARDVIGINVATAFAWIGSLTALRYIEPAIQNATVTAVGPAITVALAAVTGTRRILRAEVWSSVAIVVVIGLMTGISLTSRSGVASVAAADVLLGTVCAVVAGAGIVAQTIYAKRLGEAGLSTSYVVALRFALLVLVSGIYTFATNPLALSQIAERLGALSLLSVIGIVIPLYALQRGIERSEPITVALIVALAPSLIFCMQVFDARISMSSFTLAGVLLTTALVVASVLARHRSLR